ncbi:MAG: SPOR domain-containing protein, partial [Elusimicrobia bacterium]|nr:SPOR domain-containing protein [Elusimicrobiota bacterium]
PPAKNIRRLQVEGLLTDSKYKPLQGVYLLYFRFLDAQPGSRELWQSSMYVAVNDGAFRATLDVPESAAPRGSQGLRVSAEAPKGTGWIVKSKPYFVQVGSFESSERARELMSGLSPKFSRAFIAVSKLGAHQVRVGPFDRKADAEDAAGALQTLGHEVLVLREDR